MRNTFSENKEKLQLNNKQFFPWIIFKKNKNKQLHKIQVNKNNLS